MGDSVHAPLPMKQNLGKTPSRLLHRAHRYRPAERSFDRAEGRAALEKKRPMGFGQPEAQVQRIRQRSSLAVRLASRDAALVMKQQVDLGVKQENTPIAYALVRWRC